MIHHRLASLYHFSFRSTLASESENTRSRKLRQLSELHYTKATSFFISQNMFSHSIRTSLERAGVLEATPSAGKYKTLLQILDIILETREVVLKIVSRDKSEEHEEDEVTEERKMMETILQRLQFTLLSIMKLGANTKSKKKSDKKTEQGSKVVKELYGKTLQCNVKSETFFEDLEKLLKLVMNERNNL